MNVRTALTAVALVCFALAGCSTSAPEPSETTTDLFEQVMADTLKMVAADSQVGDEQIALLDGAARRGEVTLADMMDAMRGNQACLQEAGFTTGSVVADESFIPTFVRLEYIQAPSNLVENQQRAIIDACDTEYVKYLSRVYSFQPQSQDTYWLQADEKAPAIAACMRDHDVPDDLIGETTEEIVLSALNMLDLMGDFENYPTRIDCMQGLPAPTANR